MTLIRKNIAWGLGLLVLVALAYGILWYSGGLAAIGDTALLKERIAGLGLAGPLAIMALICLAIVFSPLPSAPIALAAGAAYGHFWGTVYVVIGAEAGALVAFAIARLLGREALSKWFGARLSLGLLGSQNALMGIVFVSRLMPFISFDLLSYAAGLTPLTLWRFALATFAGIVPASFLLAHFGGEMASAEVDRIIYSVLALGGLTALPFVVKAWTARSKKPEGRADK